jgi:hypothetical protein
MQCADKRRDRCSKANPPDHDNLRHDPRLRAATVRDYSLNPRHTLLASIAVGLLCALTAGCSPGIHWRGLSYAPIMTESQRDQKLTFVYFRYWAVVECTNFEENVLKDPRVLEALRDSGPFYCVALDFYWDYQLAEDWGLEAPPAVVILDPNERILARLSGEITIEQLLDAIKTAEEAYPAATQPASTP